MEQTHNMHTSNCVDVPKGVDIAAAMQQALLSLNIPDELALELEGVVLSHFSLTQQAALHW